MFAQRRCCFFHESHYTEMLCRRFLTPCKYDPHEKALLTFSSIFSRLELYMYAYPPLSHCRFVREFTARYGLQRCLLCVRGLAFITVCIFLDWIVFTFRLVSPQVAYIAVAIFVGCIRCENRPEIYMCSLANKFDLSFRTEPSTLN